MIKTSTYTKLKFTQVLDPAVTNADANCTSVDMKGYDEVIFVALVGESADTINATNKIEFEVEDSADDSTFADAADADLIKYVAGTNDACFALIDAATEDDNCYHTAYRGSERYVRPVINFSGTHSTGTPIGVLAIQVSYSRPTQTVTTQ